MKVVDVVAAVLQRADGSFLLAQRPVGKVYAGYWEFPGGKVEVGETRNAALNRELGEELGISVVKSYPWLTREFVYPHAKVRLNFFRVTDWEGELHGKEGQAFTWHATAQTPLIVEPMLPANAPILRALSLPDFYAISNVAELGIEEFLRRLQLALVQGLRLLQLREKNLSREQLRDLALKILPLLREHDAKLILNADIELAQEIAADGVQLTSSQLANLKQRPEVAWCGASCHNAKELRRAETLGCDFALLSPVLPTKSHPGQAALGWQKFAEIVRGSAIPVFALGGLNYADQEHAWENGAHGIAMLRQVWQ